jgi:hypothetical protein
VDTPAGLRYAAFDGEIVDLVFSDRADFQIIRELSELPFVRGNVARTSEHTVRLTVDRANTAIPALLDWARNADILVRSIEEYQLPFDDVFVQIVRKHQADETRRTEA